MNVGIVGGGAIGSYYAGLLTRAGTPAHLVTRGAHLAAIRARGLEVQVPGERFTVPVDASDDGSSVATSDVVIVAVKGYSLPEVAPMLASAARNGAGIVSLLNGVDVADRLEALGVPRASIIGGLASVSVVRTAPGVVERRSPFDQAALGELDRRATSRTRELVETLARAGISARESEDISRDLWRKFAFIVPMTVACGLSRQCVGAVLSTERGRALVMGSLDEIVAVSRATGAPLDDDDARGVRSNLLALPPAMRPSFLADVERGGPTELDLLAATVCRLGRAAGIATPIHDVAVAALEAAVVSADQRGEPALS